MYNETLGQRQDDLNKKVNVTNELILEEQIERENDKKKKRIEMKFPKFNPNLATLDLDPPKYLCSSPEKKKNRPSHCFVNLPPSFPSCCSQHLHILMNKIRNLFDMFEVKLCVYFLL